MGAWGTGIFSDDTACDIRDEFRDYIGDGMPTAGATDALLREWRDALRDPDEEPVVWLALAATQWTLGRLDDRVKDRALAIIAEGSDLRRWEEDPKLRRARERVLARLREQLQSEQPKPRRLPRRFRDRCDWPVGQLVAYTLLSGNKILLRVIGYHSDRGGTSPVCEILDWTGLEPPAGLRVHLLGSRKDRSGCKQIMIGRTSERELPRGRIALAGRLLKPLRRPDGYGAANWRTFDTILRERFDLS